MTPVHSTSRFQWVPAVFSATPSAFLALVSNAALAKPVSAGYCFRRLSRYLKISVASHSKKHFLSMCSRRSRSYQATAGDSEIHRYPLAPWRWSVNYKGRHLLSTCAGPRPSSPSKPKQILISRPNCGTGPTFPRPATSCQESHSMDLAGREDWDMRSILSIHGRRQLSA